MKIAQLLKSMAVAVTLLVAVPLTSTLQAADNDSRVKVVYPLDFPDIKRVHFMLNTLNNLVKHYQSTMTEFEINVVAYGPGLQYVMKNFKGTGFAEKPYIKHGGPVGNGSSGRFAALESLGGDSFKVYACENTMTKKKVTKAHLNDYVKVTPGGVLKIIELQREGAALIKIR